MPWGTDAVTGHRVKHLWSKTSFVGGADTAAILKVNDRRGLAYSIRALLHTWTKG